jgi:hypothetical protein
MREQLPGLRVWPLCDGPDPHPGYTSSSGRSSFLKIAMLVGRTGRKFLLLNAGSTKPSAK